MSILIPASNKSKIIALLRELSREVIYPHLSREQQELVEEQHNWMHGAESGPVTIRAKLDSNPLAQSVKFDFELIFTPAPVGKGQ